MGLGQQAYVDPVLPEEAIYFQLPAADIVGVPAGQLQGFCPCCPSGSCCHIQRKRGKGFSG
jgi:hypothetical protein